MICNCLEEVQKLNEAQGLSFLGLEEFYSVSGSLKLQSFLGIRLVKSGSNRRTKHFCRLNYCPFCGLNQMSGKPVEVANEV